MALEHRLREVQTSAVPVLAHVAGDVGELHRHAQRCGAVEGPPIMHAEQLRQPESHDGRDVVAVPVQIIQRLESRTNGIRAHPADEVGGIGERHVAPRHVAHHEVEQLDAGRVALVCGARQCFPLAQHSEQIGARARGVVHQVVGVPTPRIHAGELRAFGGRNQPSGHPERLPVPREIGIPFGLPRREGDFHRAEDRLSRRANGDGRHVVLHVCARSAMAASAIGATASAHAGHRPAAAAIRTGRARLAV